MVVWAVRSALACVLRGRIWLPFVAIAGLQLLLLGALVGFYPQLLAPIFVPLVLFLAGVGATPFPTFYLALPLVYSRLALVLSVVVTCVMIGAATVLFAQAFGRTRPEHAWRVSWKHYPSLLLVTLMLGVCLFAVPFL